MPLSPEHLRSALSGRYDLQRELGRGGMASVWLAEDLKHHRPVALKILRPELAITLGPERFLREIELTARLAHPHILPLYDSGLIPMSLTDDQAGLPWFTMPYVEGESLRARLQREQKLPVDDALHLAFEVADALHYAHRHDVLHRDIKPENILLEGGHAVVADFGIAKALSAAANPDGLSGGMAVGSPAYMSPEQAAGGRPLDARSDIYSLGCVLYEMVAGQPPFTGMTAESITRQHLVAHVPSIKVLRPTFPEAIAETIERALAKAPADRYVSAQQFAEALGAAASAGSR